MIGQLTNQDLCAFQLYTWWPLRMQHQTSHWKPALPP